MAHNLNLNQLTGQYSMFCATDRHGLPWHRLGQHVDHAATWAQAMQLAGLDWSVEKEVLFATDGRPVEAWGIFRADNRNFLGAVGPSFTPIQNVKMGEHIDQILKSIDGAHYESAGALGKGERVWAMARLPESSDIRIKGTDDVSKSFLLCCQGHDGTLSYILKLTSVRVVCQNTLTAALGTSHGSANTIKIRHTANAGAKLDSATKAVRGVQTAIADLGANLNELALRKVNKEVNRKVMAKLFGDDWQESPRKVNQIREIAQLFESNDRDAIPQVRGTAYNLLNAVTEYTDHYKSVRQTDAKQGMTIEQIRTEGAIFGAGEVLKMQAIDAILEATKDCARKPEPVSVAAPSGIDNILDMVNA